MMRSEWAARYTKALNPNAITHRIIHNPNYGGKPCEVPGTCLVPIRNKNVKPGTREAIKDSIAKEGFRNPILVYAIEDGIVLSFGGGRLKAAQELNKPVPAIVVDYTGKFDKRVRVTHDNWQDFFRDVPATFTFTDVGIDTHYGLERGRDEWYDVAGVAWIKDYDGDTSAIERESPWLDIGNET